MWHFVRDVAVNHRIDPNALETFARNNEARYHILLEGSQGYTGNPEVNTWFADALVKDFRKQMLPTEPK